MSQPPHQVQFGDDRYQFKVRYGFGQPAHPELRRLLGQGRETYLELLRQFAELRPALEKIPLEDAHDERTPHWLNGWFSSLDAISLYGLLATRNPRAYVEVGSGNSTRFARRAIVDHRLRTRVLSIDPQPRAAIDHLADDVIRMRLEDVPPAALSEFAPDDIMFIDNSHRSFQNSDVTVAFLEVLPRVPPGTLVHLHDIFLPDDYPPDWTQRFYNEQYLLAAALLMGQQHFEILFPAYFVATDPELASAVREMLGTGPLAQMAPAGGSFWMRRR